MSVRPHDAKGKLLEFESGMIGVPYLPRPGGGWNVVVVSADRRGVYHPGGYDVIVSEDQIRAALERQVGRRAGARSVAK